MVDFAVADNVKYRCRERHCSHLACSQDNDTCLRIDDWNGKLLMLGVVQKKVHKSDGLVGLFTGGDPSVRLLECGVLFCPVQTAE